MLLFLSNFLGNCTDPVPPNVQKFALKIKDYADNNKTIEDDSHILRIKREINGDIGIGESAVI